MKKLDIAHHKFIMILLILFVFIIGVFFGVKLLGISEMEGMTVLIFALVFVNSVMTYVIFTQLVHIQDAMKGRKRK